MTLRAVIFDCYDVLYVAAGPEYFAGLKKRFPQHATAIHDLGKQSDYGFISLNQLAQEIAGLTGLSAGDIRTGLEGGHARNHVLIEYIKELRPRFKTALISNMSADSLDGLFTKSELTALFDEVIISSQVGLLKPSPDIFLLAARRLGYDTSECLFIDDQAQNCDGARAVGMQALQYQNASQTLKEIKAYAQS